MHCPRKITLAILGTGALLALEGDLGRGESIFNFVYCFWVSPASPAMRNEPRIHPSSF